MVFQAELIAGSEASPPARVTPTIRDAHSEGGDALRFQLFRDALCSALLWLSHVKGYLITGGRDLVTLDLGI